MSLLNTGGAAGADKGGAAGADDAAAKAAAAGGDAGGADKGGAGVEGGDKGAAKDAVRDGEFDVNAIGEDLKNPDVYKNGLFFGKYKNLGEAAKGLKEVVGKMVEKTKAPDKYDFSKLKIDGLDGVTVDESDPIAQAMLPVLKDLGVPQEQADKLAAAYLKAFMGTQVDPAKEIEALGKDAPAMLENLKELMPTLSKEDQEDLLEVTKTAAGVRILNKFSKGRIEADIPAKLPGAEGKSAAALKDEAFAYREKHAKSIEANEEQQKEYNRLMELWAKADEAEKKAKS